MRKQSLDAYSERAMRATDAGKLIPPIVYLPRMLRGHNKRITVDEVRITTDPPTIAENHVRIAGADPLGFLIAMMHGQPIPSFEITADGAIKVRYEVPDLATRERIAKWLGHKVTIRTLDQTKDGRSSNPPEEWDELVARRNQKEQDTARDQKGY